MGRNSLRDSGVLHLGIKVTISSFQLLGQIPVRRIALKMVARGLAKAAAFALKKPAGGVEWVPTFQDMKFQDRLFNSVSIQNNVIWGWEGRGHLIHIDWGIVSRHCLNMVNRSFCFLHIREPNKRRYVWWVSKFTLAVR